MSNNANLIQEKLIIQTHVEHNLFLKVLKLMFDSIKNMLVFIIILINERFIDCYSTEVTASFFRKGGKIPTINLVTLTHHLTRT